MTRSLRRVLDCVLFTDSIRHGDSRGIARNWRLHCPMTYITNEGHLIVPYRFRELNVMPVSSASKQVSAPPTQHPWLKPALWTMMAAMTLSVIFYSEIPLLRQTKERAYLG